MGTTTYRSDNTSLRYYGRIVDSSGYRRFNATHTKLYFGFYGKSFRLHYYSNLIKPVTVEIDSDSPITFTTAVGDNWTASLLNALTDGNHTVIITPDSTLNLGGFRLLLADGIEITADGSESLSQHSATVGLAYELCGNVGFSVFGTHNFISTYSLEGYSSPSALAAQGAMTCIGHNSGIRIRAICTEIWVWCQTSTTYSDSIGLVIDNRFVGMFAAAGSDWGWQKFTGLDGTTEHIYEIMHRKYIDGVAVLGTFGTVVPTPRTSKILWFGDSVTAGDFYNSSGLFSKPPTSMTAAVSRELNATEYNRGKDGDKVTNLSSRVATDVQPTDVDLIVLHEGYNDIADLVLADPNDPANILYGDRYTALLNSILAITSAKIAVVFPFRRGVGALSGPILRTQQQRAISECNEPSRITYIETSTWPSDNLWPDASALHPSPLGYSRVFGSNIGCVLFSGQLSAGDTITINGKSFVANIDFAIGASVDATCRNLFSVASSYGIIVCQVGSANQTGIIVKAASLSSSGTNLTTYNPETNGLISSLGGLIVTYPVVTTDSITDITSSSAVATVTVSSDGQSTITARGVCWSTSIDPTILNNKTTESGTVGTFTSNLTGLNQNTTYYIRSYATNSIGTAYGNNLICTTASISGISLSVGFTSSRNRSSVIFSSLQTV